MKWNELSAALAKASLSIAISLLPNRSVCIFRPFELRKLWMGVPNQPHSWFTPQQNAIALRRPTFSSKMVPFQFFFVLLQTVLCCLTR